MFSLPMVIKTCQDRSSGGGDGVCRHLAGGEKYQKEINSFFIHLYNGVYYTIIVL